MKTPRASRDVLAQLREFDAIFPHGIPAPPPGDFAAELQCQAWQAERQGLERELAAAHAMESLRVEARAPRWLLPMLVFPPISTIYAALERLFHFGAMRTANSAQEFANSGEGLENARKRNETAKPL